MILSEHVLKGNGDKLVKEFLSTTIREYYEFMKRLGESRTRVHARDSLIFSVTQLV